MSGAPIKDRPGGELWMRNEIQFPRLLAEIYATQGVDIGALAASMDLEREDVIELLDRADEAWEMAKARNIPAKLQPSDGDGLPVPTPWLWELAGARIIAEGYGEVAEFYGPTPYANARLAVLAPELLKALMKAEAILSQLQELPDQAREIIAQGYYGHALVVSRRLIARSGKGEAHAQAAA